jgi:hypothetical protein
MDQYPTYEQLTAAPPKRRETRGRLQKHPRVKPNPLRKWFARKPQPMTLKEFAEKIGMTPSYISQLCSDDPPWPKRHVQIRIAITTGGAVTPNLMAGYSKKLLKLPIES